MNQGEAREKERTPQKARETKRMPETTRNGKIHGARFARLNGPKTQHYTTPQGKTRENEGKQRKAREIKGEHWNTRHAMRKKVHQSMQRSEARESER